MRTAVRAVPRKRSAAAIVLVLGATISLTCLRRGDEGFLEQDQTTCHYAAPVAEPTWTDVRDSLKENCASCHGGSVRRFGAPARFILDQYPDEDGGQ